MSEKEVGIEIDGEGLFKIIDSLSDFPKEVRPAIAHAINKTMDSTLTQVKKEVSSEYTIKQKDVAKTIKRERAKVNNLSSTATSLGSPIPVYKFKHSPTKPPDPKIGYKQPVRATIKKGSGRKLVKNKAGNKGFILKITSKKRNEEYNMIFARKGKKRYPIDRIFSLSIPQMISDESGKKGSIQRIQARSQEMLDKKIEQEINYRLDKVNKEAGGKGK